MTEITDEYVNKAINQLQVKPFAHSVEQMDNADLAELLVELLRHRSTIEQIKDLIT